jgi:hypothetical protein
MMSLGVRSRESSSQSSTGAREKSMTDGRVRWRAAITAALACASSSYAVAPEVKDLAGFFKPEAVAKANKEIREIARSYDRDLLVETFPVIPGDQSVRVKGMPVTEREKFFANWAEDRAEAAVVNGIYVLICKEPAHLQVLVTQKGRQVFDREAQGRLRTILLKNFREKKYDQGLQEAIQFVRDRLANKGARLPRPFRNLSNSEMEPSKLCGSCRYCQAQPRLCAPWA